MYRFLYKQKKIQNTTRVKTGYKQLFSSPRLTQPRHHHSVVPSPNTGVYRLLFFKLPSDSHNNAITHTQQVSFTHTR